MIKKKITTSWWETNVTMTKSHKLLPQIMVFPGRNWGFSALTSGPLMRYHSAAEHGTHRDSTPCVRGWHVISIDNLEHKFKKHLCFRVLRSRVLLVSLESSPGSPGVFVLQMLLVFVVRPVLWNVSTSARSVGSVCRAAYIHGQSIHSATKHTGFNPPTCPKGLLQSFRKSVQMCPGERGERITGFYVQ